jgi:medium-chain acyl-[acyl-carrier-protein] hydrolase
VNGIGPKLTCPIPFFGGQDDGVLRAELEAWADEAIRPFEIELLPGGHLFLISSRAQLLEILSRKLSALAN